MNEKTKRIVVKYLPSLNTPDLVLETTGRADYKIHSNEDGVLGYKVFADTHTVCVPREHVLRVEIDL